MHKTNYVCQSKESDYEDTWIEEASREANPEELNEEIQEAEENEEVEIETVTEEEPEEPAPSGPGLPGSAE